MKSLEYYKERMGYFPTYGVPIRLDEDDEFVYFRFRVPRHYIRFEIEEGVKWHLYKETDEVGTLTSEVVIGVRHLPVHVGIEEDGSDADFVYYRCPVPKVVMDEPVPGIDFNFSYMYTYTEKWEEDPELVEDDFEFEIPVAGTSMPNREELEAVRKAKSEIVYFYEVVFQCTDKECGETLEPFIAPDLFEAMYEQSCPYCTSTKLKIISSKAILKEEDDG
jgi:hypothetical protein